MNTSGISKLILAGSMLTTTLSTAAVAPANLLSLNEQAEELTRWLTGSMDSKGQSEENVSYFDVTVSTCRAVVDGLPGEFLYLEQAITASIDAPYRVRLVQILPNNELGTIEVINYGLAEEASLLGSCKTSEALLRLTQDQVGAEKCRLYMAKQFDEAGNPIYKGSTPEEGCVNKARGASMVTAEVTLTPSSMDSWDRGWDDNGRQVWGAILGPYRFKKQETAVQDLDIISLENTLAGRSSNEEQAEASPQSYMPISYHMCPVSSNNTRADRLVYAEQTIELPGRFLTRQRVYHIQRNPQGKVFIDTYNVDDKAMLGICSKNIEARTNLPEEAINYTSDCRISYDIEGTTFYGKSQQGGCVSNYEGAQFLTIDAKLNSSSLNIWERWFDKDGKQVAGSTEGPYIYKKAF